MWHDSGIYKPKLKKLIIFLQSVVDPIDELSFNEYLEDIRLYLDVGYLANDKIFLNNVIYAVALLRKKVPNFTAVAQINALCRQYNNVFDVFTCIDSFDINALTNLLHSKLILMGIESIFPLDQGIDDNIYIIKLRDLLESAGNGSCISLNRIITLLWILSISLTSRDCIRDISDVFASLIALCANNHRAQLTPCEFNKLWQSLKILQLRRATTEPVFRGLRSYINGIMSQFPIFTEKHSQTELVFKPYLIQWTEEYFSVYRVQEEPSAKFYNYQMDIYLLIYNGKNCAPLYQLDIEIDGPHHISDRDVSRDYLFNEYSPIKVFRFSEDGYYTNRESFLSELRASFFEFLQRNFPAMPQSSRKHEACNQSPCPEAPDYCEQETPYVETPPVVKKPSHEKHRTFKYKLHKPSKTDKIINNFSKKIKYTLTQEERKSFAERLNSECGLTSLTNDECELFGQYLAEALKERLNSLYYRCFQWLNFFVPEKIPNAEDIGSCWQQLESIMTKRL